MFDIDTAHKYYNPSQVMKKSFDSYFPETQRVVRFFGIKELTALQIANDIWADYTQNGLYGQPTAKFLDIIKVGQKNISTVNDSKELFTKEWRNLLNLIGVKLKKRTKDGNIITLAELETLCLYISLSAMNHELADEESLHKIVRSHVQKLRLTESSGSVIDPRMCIHKYIVSINREFQEEDKDTFECNVSGRTLVEYLRYAMKNSTLDISDHKLRRWNREGLIPAYSWSYIYNKEELESIIEFLAKKN